MTHALRRILAMPRRELRFRLESRLRNAGDRVRAAALRPRWDRQRLLRTLRPDVSGSPEWAAGCRSLASNDHESAHRAFAAHFSRRASVLPLNARELPAVVATITERYPDAAAEATRRADGICAGRYDLLGFRGLQAGSIPDWHRDPVTGRPAPRAFWASVPYLDPACGDHKVTWELNRHQHWLALGRAHALTGDGRFYVHFSNQLASWMAANPPLVGTNWASMLELGFRVITWLWSLEVFATPARQHGNPPWIVDMLLAIDRQLAHVEQNLSRYFSPNTHLTGEALALYVGGQALPELQASPRRAALGREILLQEAERQINDDGGHAELSPHYHRYSTDFYLFAAAVARRAGDWAAGAFEDAARRQSRYLRTMADDAGRRPAIGDDDGGQLFPVCGRDSADCRDTLAVAAVLLNEPGLAVGGIPEEAFWVCGMSAAVPVSAVAPSWTSAALRSSGYFVSRTAQGDHLVVDAGRHGFLNGGHAHADALACVLTIKGQPLLVDPGTATYTMDPVLRDRFRGTSMHNTIVVDGQPQSMPAGPFHWKSRAAARVGVWRSSEACDYVEASHDGYLPRRHVRSVLAIHGVGWWIVDRILGPQPAAIECYWHLHPQWRAALRDAHVALLRTGSRMTALASTAPLSLLAAGEHPLAAFSPGYGIVEPAPVLVGRLSTPLPAAIATFIPADSVAADDLEIAAIQLTTLPVDGFLGAAFRARWRGGATAIVAAVEETGVAAHEMAAPRNLWGTAQVRTDARVAATIERADGSADIIAVNGATTETHPGGRLLAVPERVPLVRSAAVAPSMARRTPQVNQREYMPCAE